MNARINVVPFFLKKQLGMDGLSNNPATSDKYHDRDIIHKSAEKCCYIGFILHIRVGFSFNFLESSRFPGATWFKSRVRKQKLEDNFLHYENWRERGRYHLV